MKKKYLIIGIVAFVVLICVICGFIFKGKSSKEPITFEEFKRYTEEKQFEFQNNEDMIPVNQIGKSCAANIREHVQVEFTECISEEVASQLFNNYIIYVQEFKENNASEKTVNLNHYGEYTMETSTMYMHITRIDNTIMHARVPIEDKKAVCDVMKDLGYLN